MLAESEGSRSESCGSASSTFHGAFSSRSPLCAGSENGRKSSAKLSELGVREDLKKDGEAGQDNEFVRSKKRAV